jgi:hypothetical protein
MPIILTCSECGQALRVIYHDCDCAGDQPETVEPCRNCLEEAYKQGKEYSKDKYT